MNVTMAVLDLRGREEECGASPVHAAINALRLLKAGERLEVLTSVREHSFTLAQWARKNGFAVHVEEHGREARLVFEKAS
ncbi:MAG: hypothetical protein C4334_01205 [Pyrinomonas sp.]|uniref:hypothetical protein n=1 Tax=Pyrinomonas sp. TaxID=2080306 RepID=UPI003330408F